MGVTYWLSLVYASAHRFARLVSFNICWARKVIKRLALLIIGWEVNKTWIMVGKLRACDNNFTSDFFSRRRSRLSNLKILFYQTSSFYYTPSLSHDAVLRPPLFYFIRVIVYLTVKTWGLKSLTIISINWYYQRWSYAVAWLAHPVTLSWLATCTTRWSTIYVHIYVCIYMYSLSECSSYCIYTHI